MPLEYVLGKCFFPILRKKLYLEFSFSSSHLVFLPPISIVVIEWFFDHVVEYLWCIFCLQYFLERKKTPYASMDESPVGKHSLILVSLDGLIVYYENFIIGSSLSQLLQIRSSWVLKCGKIWLVDLFIKIGYRGC